MISAHDRGFLYGDGVFETVRYCGGNLLLWDLHRSRLIQSCAALAIPLPVDQVDLLINQSLAEAPSQDCILKVIVTRGEGGRGYAPPLKATPSIVLQWHPLPAAMQQGVEQGIECVYCDHPLSLNPVTAGIKHLNRLDQVMGSIELAHISRLYPDVKEGLMCDVDGHVLEGTRSNIFAVINGHLCTPELSRAGVLGVMRSYLIEHFESAGMSVEIRPIFRHELRLASELFVCNSVLGIWPVARIQQFKNATISVDVEFPSRQMAGKAINAVQNIFP